MDYSYKNITPSVDGKLIKIKYYLSVTARINRNFLWCMLPDRDLMVRQELLMFEDISLYLQNQEIEEKDILLQLSPQVPLS